MQINTCQRSDNPYNATPQTRQLTQVTYRVRTKKLLEFEPTKTFKVTC